MLAIAKERAALLRLQDIIEFKESDAENLDLANSSFDAALCRWGLMLLPNLDAAIGKIYSSLVSGGRFAVLQFGLMRLKSQLLAWLPEL